MKSIVEERGSVVFPQFTGERVYMREFRKTDGLPLELARWQPTVDAMLDGIDTDGPIYLMIDQGLVRAGVSHRRPGLHIDGYWHPDVGVHGGHRGKAISAHGSTPPSDTGNHRGSRHSAGAGGWENATYVEHEGILLASTVTAARALAGEFHGAPSEGGNCSHIDTNGLCEVMMHAGRTYAGNVTMLHESLPVARDCLRTLVRLNVPGWTPMVSHG